MERLNSLMSQHGESNYGLAKRLNVAEGTVRHWRKGFTPRADKLKRLAAHFNVTPAWIMFGDDAADRVAEESGLYTDSITQKILSMLNNMDEEARREVLKYAEEKKLLKEFLRKKRAI